MKIAHVFGSDDHTLTLHGFNRVSVAKANHDPETIRLLRKVERE
jgi:hypothetical protein